MNPIEIEKERALRSLAVRYLRGEIDYPELTRRRQEIEDEYRRALRQATGRTTW